MRQNLSQAGAIQLQVKLFPWANRSASQASLQVCLYKCEPLSQQRKIGGGGGEEEGQGQEPHESSIAARSEGGRKCSCCCFSESFTKMPFQNSSSWTRKQKVILTGVIVVLLGTMTVFVVIGLLRFGREKTPAAEEQQWKGKGTTEHLVEIVLGRCYNFINTINSELRWVAGCSCKDWKKDWSKGNAKRK